MEAGTLYEVATDTNWITKALDSSYKLFKNLNVILVIKTYAIVQFDVWTGQDDFNDSEPMGFVGAFFYRRVDFKL